MEYVGKLSNLITSVQTFYNEINPATLSGAIDIVVVEQEDGNLACSPFHVRFGKLSLLMPQEKKVEIKVNGEVVPYLMKVGEAGEAFFVFETEHEVPEEFQTSPLMVAVTENKSNEEPPYLDIGESKDQRKDQDRDARLDAEKDAFDDEPDTHGYTNKLHLPAELQSPKMIIEEQMDKVVTKIDPYQKDTDTGYSSDVVSRTEEKLNDLAEATANMLLENEQHDVAPKNDVYPREDGSALLERVIPEAITTTTIAKETFIVRPANGDIHSVWMDVTHTSVHSRNGDENIQMENRNSHDTPYGGGEHESIVLDMAGYKTEDDKWQNGINTEAQAKTSFDDGVKRAESPQLMDQNASNVDGSAEDTTTPVRAGEDQLDTPAKNNDQRSSWGWGLARRRMTNESQESDKEIEEAAGTEQLDQANVAKKRKKGHIDQDGKVQLRSGETYRIEMSLCGFSAFGSDEQQNHKMFDSHQITYDNFMHNPNILNDRRLVFRYERRYYAAGRTGPLFTSLLLFRKPLEETNRTGTDEEETSAEISDSRESYLFGRGWRQWLSRSSVAAPTATTEDEFTAEKGNQHPEEHSANETTTFTTTTMTTSVGWSAEHMHPDNEDYEPFPVPRKNYAKTLRLTSDQLKSLNLKKGVNTISFSVTSAYQGTATCAAKIFYWDYNIQVVISDIDGTITKSDTLGHVFTMIGKDWTHNGVAKLYTDIHNNGYQFLYLTSRAIGQADYTRDYLKKVEQNNYQLPDGPVIMSPDRLFTSFHREVIMRKPEVFKMACLRDIQRLFDGRDPFYAGFGNRITDAVSYRSVNVPASRIFTIDPNSEVKLELLTGFKSSYIHLNDLVDQIFPPINKAIDEEFNDWNYWKAPLPEVELPELETLPTPTSPKPKPIVPDPSALPAASVAVSTTDRPQRSLFRSFTTRTTVESSKKTSKVMVSTSTPALLSNKETMTEKLTEDTVTVEGPKDDKAVTDQINAGDESKDDVPAALSPPSSSSSIMNKMISGSLGGVRSTLSRTFSREPQKAVMENTSDDAAPAEDEEFDSTLDDIDDELDMDSIPFI
ncbi:hypothetical protein EC973_001990 [Apophysomyces ossiformis]|uniref:phosphatidate phosphatase n=1 Tax=Apophysomyces ossiformis TaxID=679940 RepID=A0A8H7EN76_9FUNG|nr:hypothetical protein EC973_001990 [Apophysomyces ossiformis]